MQARLQAIERRDQQFFKFVVGREWESDSNMFTVSKHKPLAALLYVVGLWSPTTRKSPLIRYALPFVVPSIAVVMQIVYLMYYNENRPPMSVQDATLWASLTVLMAFHTGYAFLVLRSRGFGWLLAVATSPMCSVAAKRVRYVYSVALFLITGVIAVLSAATMIARDRAKSVPVSASDGWDVFSYISLALFHIQSFASISALLWCYLTSILSLYVFYGGIRDALERMYHQYDFKLSSANVQHSTDSSVISANANQISRKMLFIESSISAFSVACDLLDIAHRLWSVFLSAIGFTAILFIALALDTFATAAVIGDSVLDLFFIVNACAVLIVVLLLPLAVLNASVQGIAAAVSKLRAQLLVNEETVYSLFDASTTTASKPAVFSSARSPVIQSANAYLRSVNSSSESDGLLAATSMRALDRDRETFPLPPSTLLHSNYFTPTAGVSNSSSNSNSTASQYISPRVWRNCVKDNEPVLKLMEEFLVCLRTRLAHWKFAGVAVDSGVVCLVGFVFFSVDLLLVKRLFWTPAAAANIGQ